MKRLIALIRRWHRTAVIIGFLFCAWLAWWLMPPQPRLVIPFSTVPKLVGFSQDGRVLATISSGPRESTEFESPVRLWDVNTGKPKAAIGGTHRIADAQLSPDGKVVAIKQEQDAFAHQHLFFDAKTCQEKSSLRVTAPANTAYWSSDCLFSPDSEHAAITVNIGGKTSLRLWDIAHRRTVWMLSETAWPISFSPDGRWMSFANAVELWSPLSDFVVRVIDVASGKISATYSGQKCHADTPSFSPDGCLMAAQCLREETPGWQVRIWNLNTQREVVTIDGESEPVFLPHGGGLLTSSWKLKKRGLLGSWRTITFWDVSQWKKRVSVEIGDSISSPMISNTGKLVAVRFAETIPPKPWLESIANDFGFSEWAAGVHIEGVAVLDVATGKSLATIRQSHGGRMSLAPDGNTVAVEAFDGRAATKGSILLWDVPPRKSVAAVLPLWTLLALGFVVWLLRQKAFELLLRVRNHRR